MEPDGGHGSPDLDVLVVGAGPTGLSLAAFLTRWGTRVRVVDRAPDRVHESRALAIQPRTLEVLAGTGVSEILLASGNRSVHLRLHAPGRTVEMPLFDLGLEDSAYPFLLFLSQATTEAVLEEHLLGGGVHVEREVELTGLQQNPSGVACRLTRPDGTQEIVRSRYVVGCDGAHSTVRRSAGIAFDGVAHPQTFLLADVEADGITAGAAHAFVSPAGMLFFFPLGTPATWRVLAMRPRAAGPPPADAVRLPEVQAVVDAVTTGTVRLRDPVWMTHFRLQSRAARAYRAGRVLLAGDAAHIHSPAGAQGMNTGIQDAANLAWKLALVCSGHARPTLLDTYGSERAPVARRVLRFTDQAFTIATSTHPVVRVARTHIAPRVLPLAPHLGRLRTRAFRELSELAIRYPRSPLSQPAPHTVRTRPRPGDRLPDAPVVVGGGRTRLHELCGTAAWHLLLCGPPPPGVAELEGAHPGLLVVHRLDVPEAPSALDDVNVLALHRLGVGRGESAHLLVRPDGYVACRGGGDLAGVRRYLERLLPGAERSTWAVGGPSDDEGP